MSKKRKGQRTSMAWMKGLHAVKTVLKASTHVFTVAGVIVAASPVVRGVSAAAAGDLTGSVDHILYDTTGQGTGAALATQPVTTTIKAVAFNVGLPIAVGIGLIWGGGQIRKRIGN